MWHAVIMSAARSRFLRPSILALLPSGLWALDGFHPVAAVLDPDTGALRRVVSWAEVPVAYGDAEGTFPLAHGDGTGLWVQHDQQGPVLRVDEDGLAAAVWTDGFQLAACGPGVAWCVDRPSAYREPRESDRPWLELGRLLRIDRDGTPTPVGTHGRIERVQAGLDALQVRLAVPPTDGPGSGIDPRLDWVSLRWDGAVPDTLVPPTGLLSVPPHTSPVLGVHDGEEPDWGTRLDLTWDRVGRRSQYRHETRPPSDAVRTDRHLWCTGVLQPTPAAHRDRYQLLATAHTASGAEVQRWDLGPGPEVLSTVSLGARLAVTVARPGGASEVLALDPDTEQARVLLGPDTVDITDLGWPMVTQPVHADSYVTQVRSQWSRLGPGAGQMNDERTRLLGQWPDTQLEWTCSWTTRPGLVLRRQIDLFDQLGRIEHPNDATLDLWETVKSGLIPPAQDAVNGYLDL